MAYLPDQAQQKPLKSQAWLRLEPGLFCFSGYAGNGSFVVSTAANCTVIGLNLPAQPHSAPESVAKTSQVGHGRLETRTLRLIPDEHGNLSWPGVKQVFQLERKVTQLTTGVVSTETVHGITSLSPDKVDADQLLEWIQGYWGIE